MLKKIIRLNVSDIGLVLFLMGVSFLTQQIIVAIVMAFLKPEGSIFLAGSILTLTAAILALIMGINNMAAGFDFALRFSQTRRRALGSYLALTGLECALAGGLAVLFDWVERHISVELWRMLAGRVLVAVEISHGYYEIPDGIPWENVLKVEDFSFLPWWGPLAAALAVGLLGMVQGAVTQRLGAKGIWGIVLLCWMPGILLHLFDWSSHTMDRALVPLLAGLALVGLAAVVWAIWSLLHAVIRS